MSKTYRNRLAAVALTLCLLAPMASAGEKVLNFLAVETVETFAPVIAAYEKANPGVRVNYEYVPFEDLNAAVLARIGQGDSSIDVVATDTPRIPAMASRGNLQDVSDMRSRMEAVVSGQTAINEVSWDGKIYSYPMWTSTQLMYYNRTLLRKANLPDPSSDPAKRLTWEEMNDMAAAAQKAGAKWGWTFEQVDRYYQLQCLFESAGGGSGLSGEKMLTPDLLNDAWVKTAEWYGKLFASGVSPRGITPYQSLDLFANGESAFFVTGAWAIERFTRDGVDFGVAPIPYFAGGKPVTPTGSWALAINPHAANLEEAKKFLEFATLTGEGAYLTVSTNPNTPVNKEAFVKYAEKFNALAPKIGPAIAIIQHEIANTAVSRPRSIGFVAFETIMNKAFSDIRNGSDAKATLEDAQTQLKSTLSRIR